MTSITARYALALLVVTCLSANAHAEMRVAVMPFDNASSDAALDPLGTGMQAMLTTDLGAVAAFVLVERARLAQIQSELALTKTGAIDPATAAKVGKLAGATHLVAGAITVVGASMRLDARLFDVATGEVVLAAAIEGEKDAFFELEKQLVQKIIDATKAKVSAKERAQVARIHTSDFGAFARFSEGVFAFDRQDYDKAIQALKDAATMDEEFKLAKLTLGDYEVIIQKLEARAVLLDANAKKAKALAEDAVAKEQQPYIDRLWHIAKTSADAKTPEARAERLAALFQLAHLYGDINTAERDRIALHRFEDRWMLERTADALAKTYYAEAVAAWPMVTPFVTSNYAFQLPMLERDPVAAQKRWLEQLFGTDREPHRFHRDLLDDLERAPYAAARLQLDAAGYARMLERAYQLGNTLELAAVEEKYGSRKNRWRQSMADRLGGAFRMVGLFDESTKYFAEAGRLSDEAMAVKSAANEVDYNKQIVAYLKAHPSPLVREWLMLRDFGVTSWDADYREEIVKGLEQKPISVRARASLADERGFMRSGDFRYVLINGVPVWPFENARFTTGPRSDPRRAASFNYYRGPSKSAETEPYLALVGEQKTSWKTSFEVVYQPDPLWWHEGLSSTATDLTAAGFTSARPAVLFLFAVEDADVATLTDDKNAERLQRGMRAFGLALEGGEATLVELTEREVRRGNALDRYRLDAKRLAGTSGIGGAKVAVSIAVKGKKVVAKVGGKTLEATLPREASGFTGFSFLKPGYASIEKLEL